LENRSLAPVPAPSQPPQGSIDLRAFWKVLRGGIWTIVAVFAIVVGLIALWTFTQTPIYKAAVTLEVRTEVRKILPGQDPTGMGLNTYSWGAEERFYNTQIEILKSRDMAQRVVDKMGLAADPQFQGSKGPAEVLRGRIQAMPRTDTGIIEISMMGADPKRITELVNGYADEYVKRNFDRAKKGLDELLKELNDQVNKLSESARNAQLKRFTESAEANVTVPEAQNESLGKQLAQYTEQHTRTRIEVNELKSILKGVDALKAAGVDLLSIKDIATQQPVMALVAQRSELEKELEGLRVKFLPGHPELRKKQSEYDVVVAKLNDQIERIVNGYRAELDVKASLEGQLASQIQATRDQLFQAGKSSTAYQIASRDAETKGKIYESIQSKLNEIAVTSSLMNNNINVLDYAGVPQRPIRPRKVMNLFMGAFFGVLFGVGIVFLLDHLDNTVKSIEDIEQGLQLPVLSIIPMYKETTGSAVKEAFQTLKTNVLFSSDARRRNLLLMTSAGPREGKSSTIINLARTIASSGERIVVLDCDLRRPTMHDHLGLERDHGLTNYLTGSADESIDSYLKNTDVPNLKALTCGPIPPNPPELFASERFKELLKALRTRFDWVFIDSPPVISLTDSVILASMADMVAFVVKHNESEREMIRRCLQNIRNVNPHVIGAVLNSVDIEKSYSKDYYYAGYYYDHNRDEAKTKTKRRSARGILSKGTTPGA